MIQTIPLRDADPYIDGLFSTIRDEWTRMGRLDDMVPYLDKIRPEICTAPYDGFIALDDAEPVGCVWLEMAYGAYGTLACYAAKPNYCDPIIHSMLDAHKLDNVAFEFSPLQNPMFFQVTFRRIGLKEKLRHKMIYMMDTPIPSPSLPTGYSFRPVDRSHQDLVESLCHASFGGIEPYTDYSYQVPKTTQDEIFDAFFFDNCWLLDFNGAPVGCIITIEMTGWDVEKLGWIKLVGVDDAHKGKGLGKALIHQCLRRYGELNYDAVGLGVTIGNEPAYSLYRRLGFQIKEEFIEYIGPRVDS